MPISADDFDKETVPKASDAIRRMILEYLENHKNEAFTEEEVASYLYPNETLSFTDTFKISHELISLQHFHGKVEAKEILKDGKLTKYYKSK